MDKFNLDERLEADTIFVADLSISRLLLFNDNKFPWVVLVPRRNNLVELNDLTVVEYRALQQEIYDLTGKLKTLFNADKMNIATLGNVVSQLHVHIIARYHNDCCWPGPVWGNFDKEEISKDRLADLVDRIRNVL